MTCAASKKHRAAPGSDGGSLQELAHRGSRAGLPDAESTAATR